jgi:HEPN domain-containing protein
MHNVKLYQRFFDAAKLDLEAAKALKDKQLYQPAIYHLQQAYEKCVKSYFILKEIKIKIPLKQLLTIMQFA